MDNKKAIVSNLKGTHIVQKCRPLSLLRRVPFTQGELRILEAYLSQINSHEPDRREVIFTKAEFEGLLGLGRTNLAVLKKHTKGLLQKVVEVPLDGGYLQFILFDEAECDKDEFGVPTIRLHCTEKAKRLFFEIDQLGYLRYEVRYALSLNRQSSYWLYFEVLRERYRGEWTVPLAKLRDERLYLKDNESYKQFKFFKRDVLDPAVKEINEKTDCYIEYEPIKRGRAVTAIKFKYIAQEREVGEQLNFIGDCQYNLSAACDNEFSETEMKEIREAVEAVPKEILPAYTRDGDSLEARQYHFLRQMYLKLNSEDEQKKKKGKLPIPHRRKYLISIINNEKTPKKSQTGAYKKYGDLFQDEE